MCSIGCCVVSMRETADGHSVPKVAGRWQIHSVSKITRRPWGWVFFAGEDVLGMCEFCKLLSSQCKQQFTELAN